MNSLCLSNHFLRVRNIPDLAQSLPIRTGNRQVFNGIFPGYFLNHFPGLVKGVPIMSGVEFLINNLPPLINENGIDAY
ncbi:hypothetical protein ES703_46846 [subsurface metagenome]